MAAIAFAWGSGDGSHAETFNISTLTATFLWAAVASRDGAATLDDSEANTWIPLTSRVVSGPTCAVQLFYCPNPTTSNVHTFSADGDMPSVFVYAHDALLGATLVGENGAANASTNTLSTGAVTPAENGALVISAAVDVSDLSAPAADSPWDDNNASELYIADVRFTLGTRHWLQPTAGARSALWDYISGGPGPFAVAIAAFVGASGPIPLDTVEWGIEKEFAGPGGGWSEVTDDVGEEAVVCEYGIQGSEPTDRIASTGSLSYSLNNSDSNSGAAEGYYSRFHPSKCPGFDFNIGVRFWVGNDDIGRYYKHLGKLASILPVPGVHDAPETHCQSLDFMDDAARTDVPVLDAQAGQFSATLIGLLLAASSDPPVNTSFDLGADAFKFAFDGGTGQRQKLREELNKIALSEQGYYYIKGSNSADGTQHRFEQRGARVGQATAFAFDDLTISSLAITGSRDDIYSSVQVTVHPTRVDVSPVELYSLNDATLLLAAGATNDTIAGSYRDPNGGSSGGGSVGGLNMIAPVAVTDYTMNAAADGTGADLTGYLLVSAQYSGSGVKYVLTNTGPTDGYLTRLSARGRGVYRTDATVERVVPGSYGDRVLVIDLPYGTSLNVATALAEFYSAALASPLASVKSMTYCASVSPELLGAMVFLEVGDKIEITESKTGLASAEFNIQHVRLEVQRGNVFMVTYDLVPYGLAPDISVIDTAGPGIVAIGGTIQDSGGYRYHYFLPGDTEFEVLSGSGVVSHAEVGAGGAGGGLRGGGGGGGGVFTGSAAVTVGVYPISVGQGHAAAAGDDTTAFGETAVGGAVGADDGNDGADGGCGGGGSGTGTVGGSGTPGQGSPGGAGSDDGSNSTGGGGGGAGTTGNDADYFNGDGGRGLLLFDGQRHGGGGGGNGDLVSGNGKDGGGDGGAGGNPSTPGTDSTGGLTGGGFGGGGGGGEGKRGAHGGVLVRYPLVA